MRYYKWSTPLFIYLYQALGIRYQLLNETAVDQVRDILWREWRQAGQQIIDLYWSNEAVGPFNIEMKSINQVQGDCTGYYLDSNSDIVYEFYCRAGYADVCEL